ncbi:Ktr system potassium transporter B [Roseivivax halodurans JCM 10272]|uniref:Ktr system potassium transporter B n=1 Tax=Roseivivax halodurans JCM 10272 TaxID=1449350 RepID=X7EIX6_9RHOB|nr:TrkH family potassium uptake protein [Roseivivax halodurans]ETX15847.1 Ktr system potassium transporter B [Roseivivax halodurans JCM 10272]
MALIGIRAGLQRRALRLSPPSLLALTYLVFVAIGAGLLWLPVANTGEVYFLDALFTSMSAVTVTGLTVVDTGTDFTFFGQMVILLLMQLGGLGLITFAVFVLAALGVPLGLGQRLMLREDLNQSSFGDLLRLVRTVFAVALGCEAVGAALLALAFVPDLGWSEGVWASVFHSVSAFNNAGFSLWSDSLKRYATHPLVNVVVPLLFIIGGLGFVVLNDIWQKRRWRSMLLHTKIMLVGTAALILWGWVTFAALEWSNPDTLGGFGSWIDRLIVSGFQAVTPRTAGFNTIDTGAMRDSTALMTMTLMVIGAGSTSTAGGIKVTTFVVLILATVAFFRKRDELNCFGRSLGHDEVMKVLALSMVSMIIVFASIFLISTTHEGPFLRLVFEVCSAFGTVGLTMGATPELNTTGRIVIMIVMFLGRVGPLTLGFFLATHSVARVRYPPGRVFLG